MTSDSCSPNSIREMLDLTRRAQRESSVALTPVIEYLEALLAAELGPPGTPRFRSWIERTFRTVLTECGIMSGTIAEVGGSKNSFLLGWPEFTTRFLSLYPSEDPTYIHADITGCPHVPDESFDAILSVNVLEHVAKPWLAAAEVTRLLRPGGVTFHIAPFSYFYHRAPIDCWRYAPDAFCVLFERFETLCAEFYTRNRRRDNRGKAPVHLNTLAGRRS